LHIHAIDASDAFVFFIRSDARHCHWLFITVSPFLLSSMTLFSLDILRHWFFTCLLLAITLILIIIAAIRRHYAAADWHCHYSFRFADYAITPHYAHFIIIIDRLSPLPLSFWHFHYYATFALILTLAGWHSPPRHYWLLRHYWYYCPLTLALLPFDAITDYFVISLSLLIFSFHYSTLFSRFHSPLIHWYATAIEP